MELSCLLAGGRWAISKRYQQPQSAKNKVDGDISLGNTSHAGRSAGRVTCIGAAILLVLLLVLPVTGQEPVCDIKWGVRDTHVRAWFPNQSYDTEARMWLRTGADFSFISLEEPAAQISFSIVSRTSNNPITIVAHRLREPWPSGMTYSIWKGIRDDMLDGMLDQVLVDGLGRFSLKTYGAQHIMLEAQGASVGYALMSTNGWSNRPSWCREPATPTPFATSSPTAVPTQNSPINRIDVPPVVLPVIVQHAVAANSYEPGTCFEIAADKDGNGRSTSPDFLIVVHMPDGIVYRWKFQWFENGALYMAPAERPCDVGMEILR